MVYEKNGYVRFESELIKKREKTKAIKKLEEEFKDSQLSFNIKTIYKKQDFRYDPEKSSEEWIVWDWFKTYYEVSYFDNENEKHVLKFYVRRGNTPLKTVFLTALHTGGDEKECPTI